MHTKTVLVGSAIGLHARPAAVIAGRRCKLECRSRCPSRVGEPVDAGSALMIMTFGCGHGARVTVASEDEAVVSTIAGLVQSDLDAWDPIRDC